MSNGTESGTTMNSRQRSSRALAIVAGGSLLLAGVAAVPPIAAAQAGAAAPARVAAAVHPAAVLVPSTGTACVAGTGTRVCDLWARTGVNAGPGALTGVSFWSYTSAAADPVGTTGPTLVVQQGESVTLRLHNRLGTGRITSLAMPQVDSFTEDTTGVADLADKDYTFTATRPGTYLYEAGGTTDGARQTALGMVGALVVVPTAAPTTYTDEAVALLTDVDPGLHANPATYDMRNYNPRVHLVNGATFPSTTNLPVTAGSNALLRVVNGGVVQHAIGILGTNQRVVAVSSRTLSHPYGVAAENVAAGDTLDLLVSVPAATTAGLKYAVYDASTRLDSSTGAATGIVPFGGALTFLDTGSAVATSPGPSITGLVVTPARSNGSASLTFTGTAGITGDPAVTGLEYVVDNGAIATGSGTAVAGGTGPVTGTFSATGLATGSHTLLLRANSAAGWGPFAAATFVVDRTGPVASGVGLSRPSVGSSTVSTSVTVSASASDSTTGGSNVTAATYSIDGGPTQPLTLAPGPAVTVSLSGTIAKSVVDGLLEGKHTISVVASDQFANVGTAATAVLLVDRTTPTVSGVTVSPSPNNGAQGTPADPTSVEVRASFADASAGTAPGGPAASGVVSGEGFLGGTTAGTPGTGFLLTPYPTGSPTQLLGTFPVSELTRFPDGPLTVWVRAKDAAGNWGTAVAGTLVIQRDAIFASAFDSPTTLVPPWSSQVTSSGLTVANAVSGTSRQLVVTRSGSFSNNSRGYVVTTAPSAETKYKAAFQFTPGTLTTGSSTNNARILTIFAARTGAGTNALTVQYRSFGTSRQVRMQVATATGASSTAWTTLATGNGPVTLHLTWVSAASATATFTIGSTAVPSLTGLNTSGNTIETAWLGVSASSGSGTVSTGSLAFDNFDSRRTTAP